jgi:hypothetical protein
MNIIINITGLEGIPCYLSKLLTADDWISGPRSRRTLANNFSKHVSITFELRDHVTFP